MAVNLGYRMAPLEVALFAPKMGAIDKLPSRDYLNLGREPGMHLLSIRALRDYWEAYKGDDQPALEQALRSWNSEVKHAQWNTANEIKQKYRSASILKNGRVVFNICGNKFRLIVGVSYKNKNVYVKWVGTHAEYDGINAEEV